MNAILGKYGLWALGALLGGSFGFLFAKHILETNAKDEVTQLELDFKTNESNTENILIDDADDHSVEKSKNNMDDSSSYGVTNIVVTNETILKNGKKAKHTTDYNRLSKIPLKDVAKKYNIEEEETTEETSTPDLTIPYVISLEEYAIQNGHDKVVLTYYDMDDILSDETEKVVTNVENLIGLDGLLKFGQKSEDPDSVYIRNINIATDFEVVRLHKSYTEEILGIKAEKKRPARKTMKTKKVIDDDAEDN